MFHHRLISLFYRAWERNHLHLSPDPDVRASFHGYLLSLVGERGVSSRGPHAVESLRLLRHAGLWAQKRRSAEGLRILLLDRLNQTEEGTSNRGNPIEVEIIPFVPRWIVVDEERRLTLRGSGAGVGMGHGAIMGSRARDWQSRFRVRIGPLTASQFDRLQPPSPSRESAYAESPAESPFQQIVELTRRYVGPDFDFDVTLVLRAEEVPRSRLIHRDRGASRLGRTWLITRSPDRDCECTIRATDRAIRDDATRSKTSARDPV
jgi:type VI secretion system protein ImpH